MKKTVEQRFWEKVGPHTDPNVCWLWRASVVTGTTQKNPLPYGYFRVGNKTVLAHRFSYEMHYHVTIPKGMTIDHVKARGCTSTLCVNPRHLEVVTSRVNTLRGNTLTAAKAAQTYCVHGHPFNEENTGVRSYGGRYCRVCHREREQALRQKALLL